MVTEPTTASKEAMKHKTLTTPPHEDSGGGTVLPAGGNQGDVLAKHSDATDDFEWKPQGTAASKDYTANVRPDDHRLVESNAVYAAISAAISAVYKPHGEITCAELTSDLLIPENVDNLYTVSDSGTTTDLFIQGEGKTINAGDSVAIIIAGPDTYKFNLMPGIVDLSSFQHKDLDTPVEIGGETVSTVEDAIQALASQSIPTGYILKGRYTVNVVGTVGNNYQTLLNALATSIYNLARALPNGQAISPMYFKGFFPDMSFVAPGMYTNAASSSNVKELFNCCVIGVSKINTYAGMITSGGSSFSRTTVGNSVATTFENLNSTTLVENNKTITLTYELYEEV